MTVQELRDRLRALGNGRLRLIVRKELVATAREGQRGAQEAARTRLRVRTGMLRRSISSAVTEAGDGFEVHWTAGREIPLRYAALQEYGGTIVPKHRRFLAFPLPGGPAETPAGVPRFHSPRDVPGLRFVPIRGGSAGLLVKDKRGSKGKGAHSEIWYLLVRRVTIPEHRYMRDPVAEATRDLRLRLAQRLVVATTEAGNGL